jgi:replicative DNA helicase
MKYNEFDLAVLKALTSNKKHALDYISENDANLFSVDLWHAAKLIIGYLKTYKEVPTLHVLTDSLLKRGQVSQAKYIEEVWALLDTCKADEKEFKYNLSKLKAKYAEQQLLSLKERLDGEWDDPTKLVAELSKTHQTIQLLKREKASERKTLKDYIPDFKAKLKAKRDNPEVEQKIFTGYSFLDHATNGFGAADFVMIAGESGFGKSILLANLAIQIWLQGNTINTPKDQLKKGHNILFFSLEMPYENCFYRLISRLSGIPSRKIENAKLNKEEWACLKQALEFISNYPYHFEIVDIPDASAHDIERVLTDTDYNVDAIFVDYLGIMKPNESNEEQDWLKQGIIAYETRAIGRKYQLPIFSAVQLNRKGGAKDPAENIGLHRLARSNSIATHCTTIIQIESRTNEEYHPDFLYHLIKNRNGLKGKGRMMKNLACATLTDSPFETPTTDFTNFNVEDISEEAEELEL